MATIGMISGGSFGLYYNTSAAALPGRAGSVGLEQTGISDPTKDQAESASTAGISGEQNEKTPGRLSVDEDNTQKECQTCKNRKYKDGSDEMVSFKSPAHIDPQAAGAAVRAHEQEHVSNAYSKAARDNGEVISASVSIQMAVCPECGRSYVSGGTTQTQIKYYNEENPYQQDLKGADQLKYTGMNLDYAV